MEKFSKTGSTFLVKRFDRDGEQRIHFSSAMTMLGKKDGANATDGSSYLEIVSFLKANGAKPRDDVQELWKRIVFSMAVSNTDDHFRNHGFILSNDGWELSPLYDVNPDIYGEYLSLNVDEYDSGIDFDLAIESVPYYGLKKDQAKQKFAPSGGATCLGGATARCKFLFLSESLIFHIRTPTNHKFAF